VLREGGMIGYPAVEPESAEPAVCQIKVDLIAQPPLRANAKAVADEQHPDHQFGIGRWSPHRAVERGQTPSQLTKLDEPVDRSQQMIGRYVAFQRELIEQSSLIDLPMPHHDLQSCLTQRLNQRISFRATTDFFNEIGQELPHAPAANWTGKGHCEPP